MSEDLSLRLSEQSCQYVERLCPCINRCKAPDDYSCCDKNRISKNEVICKRYNSPIEKVLAKTRDMQR